jgi:hypothetical protein
MNVSRETSHLLQPWEGGFLSSVSRETKIRKTEPIDFKIQNCYNRPRNLGRSGNG